VRDRNEEGVEEVEERVEEVEEEVMLEGNEEGAGHRIRRSGIEPWLRTLCCVLGLDPLLLQCLSPRRRTDGYRRT